MARLWARIDLFATLQAVWPFVRPERRALRRAAAVTVLLSAVEVSIPLLSRSYLDRIMGDPRGYETALTIWLPNATILLLLGAGLARGGLVAWQRSLAGAIGERAAARLRTRLWSHVQDLPVEQTERRGSGRLLVQFVGDIRAVQRLMTDVMIQGSYDLLVVLVVLVVLGLLNWRMALPAILLVPIYAAIFWRLNPQLRMHSRAARRRRTRLSAFLNERILGMKVVKALVQERAEVTRVRRLTRAAARRGARLAVAAATLQGAAAAAVTISLALTLALAPGEIAAGRVTGGTLVAFILLLGLLAPVLRRIARLNRTVQEAAVSISRLSAALAQRSEGVADHAMRSLRVRTGDLAVKRVSVARADGAPVLDRVSLKARRGELVALIGPNGSGKSTLLDLLLRFKQPTSGRIVIDGRRIDNVSLASLREQVGWVPQHATLFDGTILENVTYGGRRKRSSEALERAIQLSGVAAIAARLPDGLETRVGSSGEVLSHSQRQRVALARALVADPPILVVDELTSSLDAEADQALAEMLRALAQKKTLIVATHQLPTLAVADRIYVLEHGRLVEHGTHLELLERGAAYARLVGPRQWPVASGQ